MNGMQPNVVVATSAIHGLGVFAAVDFSQGERLLPIDDSHVIDDEHPVPPGEEHHCDYLERGKTVWMQVPERYINHSCRPNVYVRTYGGVRYVVALRDIRAGEEIAYDYSVNGYGDVVWHCACGDPRCRRLIHAGFFQLPLELQREYLPLLDDWFRDEYSQEVAKLKAALAEKPDSPHP